MFLDKLAQNHSLTIEIFERIYSALKVPSLLDSLEQRTKQIVQCFLWLATVTNDDRYVARPFRSTKQLILNA